MNLIVKLCCYILLPYCVVANSDDDRPAKRTRMSSLNEGNMASTSTNEGLPEPTDAQWLQQKLDHTNLANTEKWDQRYYINKTHYTGNGPVILRIGGVKEIGSSLIESGSWFEYASKTKALLVHVEHRYFGRSRPVDDLRTENLIYLTIEQELADLGYFIARFRKRYSNYIPSTAKWIAFGGSYAGVLAVRLRMKFPHLVHAAVASSAPLLEVVNFRGFYDYVEGETNKYSGVKSVIKDAFRMIHNAIRDDKIEELKRLFNMCSLLSDNNRPKNEKLFILMIVRFLTQAMYFGDTFVNMLVGNYSSDSYNRVASIVRILLHRSHERCLLVDYDTAVEKYRNPLWDAEIRLSLRKMFGNRQNLYQRCSEFGQFQTSDQKDSLFGDEIKIEFYAGFCADVFGNEYNLKLMEEGVERANIYYGGLDIKVSHVLFVNGVLNPWYELTVNSTNETEDRIVINIPYAVAMEDLLSSANSSVRQAQKMVLDKLVEWLHM